jgi:hypothetical protein
MSDDWVLAMHAAIERDARTATVADPDDGPDDGEIQTVAWDRVPTPGGGFIDTQFVTSSASGQRRRLMIVEFDARDPEHQRRIEAAIRALDG